MKKLYFIMAAATAGAALFFMSASVVEAEVSDKDGDKSGYARGLSLGLVYSKGISKEEQKAFLQGVQDGLNGNTSKMNAQELNAVLNAWVNSKINEGHNKAAYAFGWGTGFGLLEQDPAINPLFISQGFLDSYRKDAGVMDKDKANAEIMSYSHEQNKAFMEVRKKEYLRNQQAGKEFLEKNKSKKGIVALDNGLQYEVLSRGDPALKSPEMDSIVKIQVTVKNLEGKLLYNTETDYGKPLEVKVSSTIKGWQDALVRMKPGAKWRLFIPENLAFQEYGWKDKIEPGQTAIYDIQLLSVETRKEESKKS